MQAIPHTSNEQNQTKDHLDPRTPRWWLLAVVALFALASGAVGGAMLTDGGGGEPDVIRADGGEPTARQQEMARIAQEYGASWQATDGERAASFLTDDGYVEYVEDDWTFYVTDGSLQRRISNGPYSTFQFVGPMVVYDDRVVSFGTVSSYGVNWLSIIHFTENGEVRIKSEHIAHWQTGEPPR